ncbi:hypothetical protein F9C11_11715 [Amycolatopsis sp. VS8301801F10]
MNDKTQPAVRTVEGAVAARWRAGMTEFRTPSRRWAISGSPRPVVP